jgi:GT2 family glycosyltransferase
MVDRRLFEVVGEFDEGFTPAYLEDADMAYRMRLRGVSAVTCHAALILNYDRGTIKGLVDCSYSEIGACAQLTRNLREDISKNDSRYLRKWGGSAGHEKFTEPFNGDVPS